MALLSKGSSVEESPEDKGASAPSGGEVPRYHGGSLWHSTPVQRLFAGELFVTMRAKGFVAFTMVRTLNMLIHGILGLVRFEAMFKDGSSGLL